MPEGRGANAASITCGTAGAERVSPLCEKFLPMAWLMAHFPSHPPLLELLISASAGNGQKRYSGNQSKAPLYVLSPEKVCLRVAIYSLKYWIKQRRKYHSSTCTLAAADASLCDQIVSPSEQAGMDLQEEAECG